MLQDCDDLRSVRGNLPRPSTVWYTLSLGHILFPGTEELCPLVEHTDENNNVVALCCTWFKFRPGYKPAFAPTPGQKAEIGNLELGHAFYHVRQSASFGL